MIEFINLSNDVINLINNLYFLIINYKTVYKSFAHKNYEQFYNDIKKKNKIKKKCFLSIIVIKITNQIFVIKIVHIWNRATYFFENCNGMFFEDMKDFSKKKVFDSLCIIDFTKVNSFIKQYTHFIYIRFIIFNHLIHLCHDR